MFLYQRNNGYSLVEIIVASAIMAGAGMALIIAFNTIVLSMIRNQYTAEAAFLGEEGLEAVRSIRDENWVNISSLTNDSNYYLYLGNNWQATTTLQKEGMFIRTFSLSSAYRDGNNDLALSGTSDPDFRKVDVSVAWRTLGATTTKSFSAYIGNIFSDE